MRHSLRVLASVAAAVALAACLASSAGAYGGGAGHDTWQIGVSFNCNSPAFCADGLGGFWGWAEFDRSTDGSQTWGDFEGAFCFHTLGGGGAGAGHTSIEIDSWTIGPGSAGEETFLATGTETDSFRGQRQSFDLTADDTGIPAMPGHYSTDEIMGFHAPPGVTIQIQVAFRPAR